MRYDDLEDYIRESNFIAMRAAIALGGVVGLFITPMSWAWIVFSAVAAYGVASIIWMTMAVLSVPPHDDNDRERLAQPNISSGSQRPIIYNTRISAGQKENEP